MDLVDRLRERVAVAPRQSALGNSTIAAAPRATAEQIARTVRRLGFELPPFLRRVYADVANGGFGPGYGVMGVEGGFTDDLKQTIVDARDGLLMGETDDAHWEWPRTYVPFCHWGCAVYSVVDCGAIGNAVLWADVGKDPDAPMSSVFRPHKPTLESWFGDWLDGRDLWADRR